MALDRHMFSGKLQRYMTQFQVNADVVCASTGIEPARLAAMLGSTTDPTGDEVLILADYFKCDFKFFISNEKLASFEQTESLFRKHGTELSQQDRWAIQEFLFLCECQEFLLSELSQGPRRHFSFTKHGTFFKRHGEEAASELRRYIGWASNEIPPNVFQVFRDIGVHVFRRQLGSSTISGLFIRHPIAGACVLVNYSEDVFRQRFTAAHEAGHAILDTDQDFVVSFNDWAKGDLSEIRANTFASRFLLPPEVIQAIPDAKSWTEQKFLDYAARLMVNAETMAYALRDANLISDAEVTSLKKLKVPKARKADPELPETLGVRSRQRKEELLQRGLSDSYVALCFDAYDRGIVTAARVAEMLLVAEAELSGLASLYGRALSHGD